MDAPRDPRRGRALSLAECPPSRILIGTMSESLALLRHREDAVHARLERVRTDAYALQQNREHVAARLEVYERALAENAPFRAADATTDDGAPPVTLDDLRRREDDLMRDAEELRRKIERRGVHRELPLVAEVHIATPCDARWSEMVGDHRVRHCLHCDKDVFNISQLDATEAEALLREKAGGACLRLYRRSDGTVLTQDCPSGQRRRLLGRVTGGLVVFGIVLAAGAYAFIASSTKVQAAAKMGAQAEFR